ncbi:MAG: cell division protein FtsL [Thermodesulfobacteriota bacterium]|nr:cell division protein FtsL [Thermodesulfobacteriota bacterium]
MVVAGRKRVRHKLLHCVAIAFVFMVVALVSVWFRVSITNIDYRIAEEMHRGASLLEENRKLKVEVATLKSPRSIESIASTRLGMRYPERDQVIFLK